MLALLVLLFVVIPLAELVLLIQLGQWVGLLPTLALVVTTGVVGAALARAEGVRTFRAFQKEVAEGRVPGTPLLDGLAVLVGGAFLLTPGLLTDVAGFSLLFPPTRRWIKRGMRRWVERQVEAGNVRVQVWTPWSGDVRGRDLEGEGDPPDPSLDPSKEIRQGDVP